MSMLKGTNVSSALRPYDSQDTYATHEAQYGKGGHRTVNTLVERNNIPLDRREPLMTVGVLQTGLIYVLNNNPATPATSDSDWGLHINSGNNIIDISPEADGTLTLLPGNLYKTPAVATVKIDLVSVSRYSKIVWNLSIGTTVPALTFSDTIYWRYDNDLEFLANSYNVFEFESWDDGATWYGKINKYSTTTPDDFITKTDVENMIGGWQTLNI